MLSVVKVSDWLKTSSEKLGKAGISTARLDCLVLLEDVTKKSRVWLLAHPEFEISEIQASKLNGFIKKRANHEPLAFIRGKTEFYGREFVVNHDVLEPRPESETMVELALEVIGSRLEVRDKKTIVDVGTGSGAIAVSVKLEVPELDVIGTDVSDDCLKVAQQNADKHKVNIKFLKGNLLEPVYNLKPITCNLVLANLPYVPNDFTLSKAAMQEPKIAIFGGQDGLDLYRKMFAQTANLLPRPKYILTESLPFQHKELSKIASMAGYKQAQESDFIQLFTPE